MPILRQLAILAAALLAAGLAAQAASPVMLPSGEPDPGGANLRLWLRADSGIQDDQGRGPADADFSGMVATWGDRSKCKFDLAAPPGKAPLFVPRQPAAGNRPTVAFSGEQVLTRTNSVLHDRPTSTVVLVVEGRPGYGNIYSVGKTDPRERLDLRFHGEPDFALSHVEGTYLTSGGQRRIEMPLALPGDGRSGGRFVVILSNGDADRRTLEFHDGLGDLLGTQRAVSLLAPHQPASDKCPHELYLGSVDENNRFCGQVAEMLVFNRGLSTAECREMVNYLRRRYELDMTEAFFPPGTFLLQAEDFEGNWQLMVATGPDMGRYLGNQHVTAEGKAAAEGIRTTVQLPRDGKYHVWVRALENSYMAVPLNGTAIRTFVQGKELRSTHARGPGSAIVWREAGEVELKAGPAEIVVRGEGPGVKDCDAVLISPAAATVDTIEEICALAQRVRRVGGAARVTALYENGLRLDGSLLTGWRWVGPSEQVPRPDRAVLPPLVCLQFDRRGTVMAAASETVFEFQNGDRMMGTICGFVPASTTESQATPAQLIVRPPWAPVKDSKQNITVNTDWLRRIVFDPALRDRPGAAKTLLCRDGRRYAFRAIRWGAEAVSVLTAENLERIPLVEIADLRLAPDDPWERYYRELSVLDPEGHAGIVRVETFEGMAITASTYQATATKQMSQIRGERDAVASQRLLQPVWSREPLPVSWAGIRLLWQAPAEVVPLSRFVPEQVAQGGPLGRSWKWQTDRNVAGGVLRSDGLEFLWGFGVHAPCELVFTLPDCVRAFRTGVGIDAVVGNTGRAVAKVYVNHARGTALYESKSLAGADMPVATGEIRLPPAAGAARKLVLVTEGAGEVPGEGSGLDMGNHVDWLEPTLLLDPALLHAEVAKQAAR